MARGNIKEFFKIKRPDGLFSNGGHKSQFDSKGKIWTTMSGLKNHINLAGGMLRAGYEKCVVVHVMVTETVKEEIAVSELIQKDVKKKEAKKQRWEAQQAKELKERELKELERLKNKYESDASNRPAYPF